MLVKHNPVFVPPIPDNLAKLNHTTVVVRFKDGTQTTGEPVLYWKDNAILLMWAYSRQWTTPDEIDGIAPRHHDTIEEL